MNETDQPGAIERPLPVVDETNCAYWRSGASGALSFAACQACSHLLHPPPPVCRYCGSEDIGWRAVSGRGVVIGVTVNHHQWDPRFATPYVIATVAIDEDPRIRVVTNLVDLDVESAHVGMRVAVRFEHVEDVWIPVFAPVDEPAGAIPQDETPPEDHRRWVRPMLTTTKFEDQVAITGIGSTPIGRRLGRSPLSLAVEAVRAAVADAGLEMDDIDGLSTYPGASNAGGFSEGGINALEDVLGLRPTWYNGGAETFGPGGSVIAAMLAVSAGLARHVVCFRTVWQATYIAQQRAVAALEPRSTGAGREHARLAGFDGPYGLGSAANTLAMRASNHFQQYGTTRETLGWIALNQRNNAQLNPEAVYRDPLTMDDYLSARMISTPLGLYDCDVPVDGSMAVVVSDVSAARDLANVPVLVEAVGTQITERITWDQSTMTHEPQVLGPAAHLWSRTSLGPDDVDVALLYDGFTFNCLSWIEALGFCKIGEAKDFLDGGRNISINGGVVALNPHGGQLSAGRTHGMGFVHEAVVQLRGNAGARQVPDARTALVSSGGLTPGGAILLRRA